MGLRRARDTSRLPRAADTEYDVLGK